MGRHREAKLVGRCYGHYTIIGWDEKSRWMARCSCGAEVRVSRWSLEHSKWLCCRKCLSRIKRSGSWEAAEMERWNELWEQIGANAWAWAQKLAELGIALDHRLYDGAGQNLPSRVYVLLRDAGYVEPHPADLDFARANVPDFSKRAEVFSTLNRIITETERAKELGAADDEELDRVGKPYKRMRRTVDKASVTV